MEKGVGSAPRLWRLRREERKGEERAYLVHGGEVFHRRL